jgi:hypothetical protein
VANNRLVRGKAKQAKFNSVSLRIDTNSNWSIKGARHHLHFDDTSPAVAQQKHIQHILTASFVCHSKKAWSVYIFTCFHLSLCLSQIAAAHQCSPQLTRQCLDHPINTEDRCEFNFLRQYIMRVAFYQSHCRNDILFVGSHKWCEIRNDER